MWPNRSNRTERDNVGYLAYYWHSVSDDFYVLWDPSVTHKTLAAIPKDEHRGPFLVAGASEMTYLEGSVPWIKERHYWGQGYGRPRVVSDSCECWAKAPLHRRPRDPHRNLFGCGMK